MYVHFNIKGKKMHFIMHIEVAANLKILSASSLNIQISILHYPSNYFGIILRVGCLKPVITNTACKPYVMKKVCCRMKK